jgi:ASC-1-like (ASCH) protein
MKKHILKIAQTGRYIFDAIKKGQKKIETRAGTEKYQKIVAGDILVFSCGKDSFEKEVKKVKHFKTIKALLKVYKPQEINPKTKTEKETVEMYYSFPDYEQKIKDFGILAFELKDFA